MVNKKYLYICFMLFFIFLNLNSQSDTSDMKEKNTFSNEINQHNLKKNYFIEENDEGIFFIQRLSWENIEDISSYHFILEKQESKTWEIIEDKQIKENFIDISLKPGKYRYKVAIINLLDQLEEYSDYRNFEIKIAHQPKLYSVSPQTIYFDDIYPDEISLKGKNLYEDTIYSLKNIKNKNKIIGKLVEGSEKGNRATIQFNMLQVATGEYVFSVVDPSSLKDESQTMIFKFQKPVDCYLSCGYAFDGFVNAKTFQEYFNSKFVALGGITRLSLMVYKRIFGTFGFNITGSGMYLKNKEEFFTLKSGLLISEINAGYIVSIIKRRLNFDLHLGIAALFLVKTQYEFKDVESKSPDFFAWGLGFSAGTAFQIYLYKKLYMELNVEHIVPFREGLPKYIYQPSISIGWEF